jgi:hypothetical protein
MKLDLITELVESRMFRSERSISTIPPRQLAEYFYVALLYLNALRYEKSNGAKSYAQSTLRYNEFDSVKSSATDLYNLAAGALKNQQFPELGFKRWLHDIIAEREDTRQDYTLFTKFEDVLKIDSSGIRGLRRISIYYNEYSAAAKKNFWVTMNRYLSTHMRTIDLLALKPNF